MAKLFEQGGARGAGMTRSGATRETAAEIIALRMREYDSLRNEIQQRVAARTQIAGFAGVIAALLSAENLSLDRPNLYVTALIVGFSLLWWRRSNLGILRLGHHLREIERDVNELATAAYGRPALSWETHRHQQRRAETRFWRALGRAGGWIQRG
ncbi:hypothetical protein [Streptomyces mayteni]